MPIKQMTRDEKLDDALYQVSRSSEAVKEDCLCIIRHLTWRNGNDPIKTLVDLYRVFYGWLVILHLENWQKNQENKS